MADEHFDSVRLLMHFDGTDGATTFVDSSGGAEKTFYAYGILPYAALGTDQKKFGTASLKCGPSDRLESWEIDGIPWADIGTGDFTVEAFFRVSSWAANSYTNICGVEDSSGNGWYIYLDDTSGTSQLHALINGAVLDGNVTIAANTWYFVHLQRSGTDVTLTLDGAVVASGTSSADITLNKDDDTEYSIGGPQNPVSIWVDEHRYTVGVARYSSFPFSPPSEAFSDSGPSGLTDEEMIFAPFKTFADLYEGETSVRVPISSCQATLRADTSHYAQIVVPQGSTWAATLAASDHFAIVYAACSDDGAVLEEIEVCRAPVSNISYARGPTNDTATVTGNWEADPLDPFPQWETNRRLYGTQQEFTTDAGKRYRCKVDPLMRPSRLALFDDTTAILVELVGFYISRSVAYMDVGGSIQALGLRSGTSVGHAGAAAGYSTLTAGHGHSVGHGSAVAVDAT